MAQIWTFGYDAYVARWTTPVAANRIGDHAYNLLHEISITLDDPSTGTRPIIFVAHSLGGLVVANALAIATNKDSDIRKIDTRTRGILFMGTPHAGGAYASFVHGLAKALGSVQLANPDIMGVLRRDSEVLANIQDEFHSMLLNRDRHIIKIVSFDEELPTSGVGFVGILG